VARAFAREGAKVHLAGDAERLADLAHRFGRYRIYGEDEHIDLDIGRGLFPRHDSVQHLLRTGALPRGRLTGSALTSRGRRCRRRGRRRS
jgi:hypothetical protein